MENRKYRAEINIYIGNDYKEIVSLTDKGVKFKRSSVNVSEKSGYIRIEVRADDATALLASVNSVLKQIRIINEIKSFVKEEKEKSRTKKQVKK